MGLEAAIIGGVLGAGATAYSANKASKSAAREGERVDALERERFEESKRQADLLRQQGNEAAAQAMEEATRAELGAEKFQALMQGFATQADEAAQRREQNALNIYQRIQESAKAKQAAGQSAQQAIQSASQEVMRAAGINERQLNQALTTATNTMNKAFSNIESRYSPFMESERQAIGQLGVEMGLTQGDQYKGYRDTPAYMAAQEASRVAEAEGIAGINQAAGNTGTLYSGTRGAALVDRTKAGSYERAGIEQSYYQNYMNMLRDMSNPVATGAVSGYEAQNARDIGQMGMDTASQIAQGRSNAAGTNLNATIAGQQIGLDTMRTGAEGAELLNYMNPGTAGAQYAIAGYDAGTAGSPYRMAAQDYRLNAAQTGAGLITGNMPTGIAGSNARLEGTAASNAAIADLIAGGSNLYGAYMQYGQGSPTSTTPSNVNRGPTYTQPYTPPTNMLNYFMQ